MVCLKNQRKRTQEDCKVPKLLLIESTIPHLHGFDDPKLLLIESTIPHLHGFDDKNLY
jgi:hypothetical protein